MALKLVGKKAYDYTNEKGQNYTGIKMHCVQDRPSETEGYLVETISVGTNKPVFATADDLPFGTIFTPVYDRYGRIQDIMIVSLPGDKPEVKK